MRRWRMLRPTERSPRRARLRLLKMTRRRTTQRRTLMMRIWRLRSLSSAPWTQRRYERYRRQFKLILTIAALPANFGHHHW